MIRLCGDGAVSKKATMGSIFYTGKSTPPAHTQNRAVPTHHRTPDAPRWRSRLALDVGEGQKLNRFQIGLVYSRTIHALFRKIVIFDIVLWLFGYLMFGIAFAPRPSLKSGWFWRTTKFCHVISILVGGLSNTAFVCLSRTPKGAQHLLTESQTLIVSDVAALISSLFPGIQSLVPTVI
jgi:hypothetical protein